MCCEVNSDIELIIKMEKKDKIRNRNFENGDCLESYNSLSSETQGKKVAKTSEKKVTKEKSNSVKSITNKNNSALVSKSQKSLSVKSLQSDIRKGKNTSNTPSTSNVLTSKSKFDKKVIENSKKVDGKINSIRIASNILLNPSSPRTKYTKTQNEKNIQSGVKPKFTNVTVRSPTREQNKDTITNIDNISRTHKRYRTRTLEPNEIKVLKPEDDPNTNKAKAEKVSKIIKNDLQRMQVAKPEAFFINLEETFNKPETKSKTPIQLESGSESYDDDFDSYESDFESFASSSHGVSDSDHDRTEDCLSDNPEKNPRDNSKTSDEAPLDSGNYELKIDVSDVSKNEEMKFDLEYDKIPYTFLSRREAESAKMPSYSDEGFDENSGIFMSTTNSANVKLEYSSNEMTNEGSVLEAIRHARGLKQKLNYYQQRAHDLSSLITFDNLEYSLFEINPIPYDVFIKTFGKSNVIQRSSQTNDDYVDDFTQTEIIMKENKWCQYPVDYSKYDIESVVVDVKQKRPLNIHVDEHWDKKTHNKMKLQTNIVVIENPLEMFRKQRLGCSYDININKSSDLTKLYSDQRLYEKLYKFIDTVGKQMTRYLKQTSCSEINDHKNIKSKYSFSESYNTPLRNASRAATFLQNRNPTIVSICPENVHLLLTVHPNVKNDSNAFVKDVIFSRTIICIWDCSVNVVNDPTMVLLSVDNITSCQLHNGLTGFVVAGTEDGITCAWDLEEHDMWHKLIQDTIDDRSLLKNNENEIQSSVNNLVIRCCSFSSFSMDINEEFQKNFGSVVHILIDKFQMDSTLNEFQGNNFNQVCVLQEHGLIVIWTVIKSKMTFLKSISDASNHTSQSYWSSMKFYKHIVLNIQEHFKHISVLNNSTMNENLVKKSLSFQEFPLTNVKRKNSYKRVVTPRGAGGDTLNANQMKDQSYDHERINEKNINVRLSPDENDLSIDWESRLKCLCLKFMFDSHEKAHFLIACSSGWVLHYDHRGNLQHPQVFMCSGSTSLVRYIEICHHNRSYFLAACDNSVDLFCITQPRPLKSFLNEITEDICKRFHREEITCVEWSKLRPCLFLTLSNRGRLTVWDLLKSDLVPIMSELLRKENDFVKSMQLVLDKKQSSSKEYLILHYSSGNIEQHKLLNDYMKSSHQSKDTEAMVLDRYMQLL